MRVVPIYCSLLSPLSFLRGPGFSFVSRDEVARPEKLAERGCVALLALRGCFLYSCVLRVLKDFAALFWSARLEDLGPRGVFTKGRGPGKPCQWGLESRHCRRGLPAPPSPLPSVYKPFPLHSAS